jgi:hypothetical protein
MYIYIYYLGYDITYERENIALLAACILLFVPPKHL